SYWQNWWIENAVRLFYKDLYKSGNYIEGLEEIDEFTLITMDLMSLSYTIEQSEEKYYENIHSIKWIQQDVHNYTDSYFRITVKPTLNDIFTKWTKTWVEAGISDDPPSRQGSASSVNPKPLPSFLHQFYTCLRTHEIGGEAREYSQTLEDNTFNEYMNTYEPDYVDLIYIYIEWKEWFSGGWDCKWFDQKYIDDDVEAPIFRGTRFDPYITLASNYYNINVTFQDKSGWEGEIEYRFDDSPISFDIIGSTNSKENVTLTYKIPKEIWSDYLDTIIKFRVRAIDNDTDRTFVSDRNQTDWSSWIDAGKIVTSVIGNIETIKSYVKTPDGWRLQVISTDQDNPLYRDLYVKDLNYIKCSIDNPLNESIKITNAILFIACPKFPPTYDPSLIIISPINYLILNKFERITFDREVAFGSFTDFNFTSLEINFTFFFIYIKQTSEPDIEYYYETSKIYTIIKPPKPTVEFVDFYGTKEEGTFIYKTGYGEAAQITAKFRIINHARVPIDISHNFSSQTDHTNVLTYLDTNLVYIVEPGEIKNIEFKMKSRTDYFLDEQRLFKLIKLGAVIIEIAAIIFEIFKLGRSVAEAISAAASPFNLFMLGYHTALNLIALFSRETQRALNFNSSMEWWYIQNEGGDTPHNSVFQYENIEPDINKTLVLKPAWGQEAGFYGGYTVRIAAVGLYGLAAALMTNAYTYGAGSLASLGATALAYLSDYIWAEANDDILENEDYNNVYLPQYESYNLTDYQPQNELEESLVNLANTSIHLKADLEAQNITMSKKKKAESIGDYNATLKQNDALIENSERLIDGYEKLSNEMEIITHYISKNSSEFINTTSNYETGLAVNGLSEDNIELLELYGLNQTEIQDFNQTVVESARNNEYSNNFTIIINAMDENLNQLIEYGNNEIRTLENNTASIKHEIIDIKVNNLNESISIADDKTLYQLKQLKGEIDSLYQMGEWSDVVEKSDELIELAEQTAFETNNNTYLTEYRDYALEYKRNAKEYLKINLYHLDETVIMDNQVKTLTVIAHSHGAPTGNYILETNCSWVTPAQQIVSVQQYNKTIAKLTISTKDNPLILLGIYYVNLKLYLPQTQTIINSLLRVDVKDDDISIPNIQINYTGDGTDGIPGFWDVNVTDLESGLDKIQIYIDGIQTIEESLSGEITRIYTFSIQNTLGNHEIEVIALNFDTDWDGDQEANSEIHAVFIKDDDTIAPVNWINYIGDGT
ncbi:MAG: hypothetical protein ACFFD2_25360, partial [Promethearchaeota archaeon]